MSIRGFLAHNDHNYAGYEEQPAINPLPAPRTQKRTSLARPFLFTSVTSYDNLLDFNILYISVYDYLKVCKMIFSKIVFVVVVF